MVDTTLSPYAYVAGNPLNGTDPIGLYGVGGVLSSALDDLVGASTVDAGACAATVEVPGVDVATCGSDALLWVGTGIIGLGTLLFSSDGDTACTTAYKPAYKDARSSCRISWSGAASFNGLVRVTVTPT